MAFNNVMDVFVDEEWVELLAEDELSNARLYQNWEILPPEIQRELYKQEKEKINGRLSEDLYFDYLNFVVAN